MTSKTVKMPKRPTVAALQAQIEDMRKAFAAYQVDSGCGCCGYDTSAAERLFNGKATAEDRAYVDDRLRRYGSEYEPQANYMAPPPGTKPGPGDKGFL